MSKRFAGPMRTTVPIPDDDQDEVPPPPTLPSTPLAEAKLTGLAPADAEDAEAIESFSPRLTKRPAPIQTLAPSVAARREIFSPYLQAQVQTAVRTMGDTDIYLGQAALAGLWIGVPMWANSAWDDQPVPGNLPLEWLLGASGLPLGLVVTLAGAWGSRKSTFAMELLRYIELYAGTSVYIDHESKISPNLPPSLWGPATEKIMVVRAKAVDHWQKILTSFTRSAKLLMTKGFKHTVERRIKKGGKTVVRTRIKQEKPGRSVPHAWVVDTVSGKLAKEHQDKTLEKGHGDRYHPIEALMINNYLKTFADVLENWPFLLIFVNQLKVRKVEGEDQKSKAGGQAIDFQESIDLEFSKLGNPKEYANYRSVKIRIRNEKNSVGMDKRRVDVNILSWEEPDPAQPQGFALRTAFDWNAALISLLLDPHGAGHGRYARNLKQEGWHLGLTKKGDAAGLAYSDTLGMKSKDAVPFRELGDMIHRDPKVLAMLRRALCIQTIPYLDGDMLAGREQLRRELAKKHPNALASYLAERNQQRQERQAAKMEAEGDDA